MRKSRKMTETFTFPSMAYGQLYVATHWDIMRPQYCTTRTIDWVLPLSQWQNTFRKTGAGDLCATINWLTKTNVAGL